MTETKASTWMNRFGVLEDVTERTGAKGPFITFKLQAKGFVQYGACFDEDIIAQMKQAVGQNVWMRGPVDTHQGRDRDGNPKEMKSFKVVVFRLSNSASDDMPAEAEAA